MKCVGISRSLSIVVAAGLLALLTACQPVVPAPVVDREPPPSRRIDYHYVSRNETLFDIAWRYELDMDTLAQVNDLPPPYHLRPGQRLSLDLRGQRASSGGRTVTASGVVVQAAPDAGGLRVIETSPPVSVPQPREEAPVLVPEQVPPVAAPPSEPEVAASTPTVSVPEPEPIPEATPQPEPTPEPSPGVVRGGITWHWPIPGRVSKYHDASGVLKGVNIQSSEGSPVHPAAPGVVVYAGEGLRGYGRLIIIKHSDEYLTAYAHNRLILVEEGASVTRDSVIAEVGGAIDQPGSLYFEVRRNGKPIDPMEVMPPT